MENKEKKSKGNTKVPIVILAALILVFGILLTYIRYKDINIAKKAAQNETEEALNTEYEQIYDRIVNMDIDSYPSLPDDVMNLYTKFYMLMYSNYLDDDRLKELVIKGRIFFGPKLLESNPEDLQLLTLETEINSLNDLDVHIVDIIAEPCAASSEDQGVYTCYVTRKLSNGLTTYWKYYLEETPEQVIKIRAWERAEQK